MTKLFSGRSHPVDRIDRLPAAQDRCDIGKHLVANLGVRLGRVVRRVWTDQDGVQRQQRIVGRRRFLLECVDAGTKWRRRTKSANATSSTSPPQDTLMSIAPSFMRDRASADMMFLVSGAAGTCSETMSALASRSSKPTGSAPPAVMRSAGICGSYAMI